MIGADCHIHVLDARFTSAAAVPPGMTLDDYLSVRSAYGSDRVVLVQSKAYGTDPACLLDALRRLGPSGRGIAVVAPSISDCELTRLDAAGVRGLRFSLWNPDDAVVSLDQLPPLAARLAEIGWHVQLHMSADQIAGAADLLRALPCTMVFDHMGRLPPGPDATQHPAFALITDLAAEGRAWVKLSGPYLNRRPGCPEDWIAPGRALVAAIPDRLVWGSDWPHVTEQPTPPDPGAIARTLNVWCDDEPALMDRIRIANPAGLYGFA